MKITKRKEHGFTLIEILVAITLMSILLAVAVPQYLQYVARGQAAEGTSLAFSLVDEIQDTYSFTQTLPTSLVDVDGGLPADHSGRYVQTTDIDAGAIVVTYGNDAGADINGQTLVLAAYVNGADDLFYFCDTMTAPAGLTRVDASVLATTLPTSALPRDCR